jgi:hypothetical protein
MTDTKVWLITGAGRGLGLVIFLTFNATTGVDPERSFTSVSFPA